MLRGFEYGRLTVPGSTETSVRAVRDGCRSSGAGGAGVRGDYAARLEKRGGDDAP
ncbi:hypothetical protein ACIGEZ_27370 [Streptomyces sp. NPDC085481]|uniref:hypothetical protein n=1 Tax=Streptomyces sp. NPDC085481 TaxID=3365727 RepID=UPI0037D89128